MATPETAADVRGYLAAFGETVRIKGCDYLGIVSNDYAQVEIGIASLSSNAPFVSLAWPDVAAAAVVLGDAVTIDAVSYEVREIMPDGHKKLTRLRLVEV